MASNPPAGGQPATEHPQNETDALHRAVQATSAMVKKAVAASDMVQRWREQVPLKPTGR